MNAKNHALKFIVASMLGAAFMPTYAQEKTGDDNRSDVGGVFSQSTPVSKNAYAYTKRESAKPVQSDNLRSQPSAADLAAIPGALVSELPTRGSTPLPLIPSSKPATFEQHAQMRLALENAAKERAIEEKRLAQERAAEEARKPQVVVIQQPVDPMANSIWALPGMVLSKILGR